MQIYISDVSSGLTRSKLMLKGLPKEVQFFSLHADTDALAPQVGTTGVLAGRVCRMGRSMHHDEEVVVGVDMG